MDVNFLFSTDQETCFDSRGNAISCAGTGQDGEVRAQRPWPCPRFEADGPLVLDRLTGLTWVRDASRLEFPLSHDEALDAIAAMNPEASLGHTDWRLPTRRELFSLVSHGRINPSLPQGHPFANVFPGYYWSSTPCARFPGQAWCVHMGGGRVFQGMRHGACIVWPVRGGQEMPEAAGAGKRFIIQDGTVTDALTGLIWTNSPVSDRELISWQQALDAACALNLSCHGGKTGWRLPTVREMDSLLDFSSHSPALPPRHPFTHAPQACWTSTTSAYDPSYSWCAYLQDGRIGVGFKEKPEFSAWAVCSG